MHRIAILAIAIMAGDQSSAHAEDWSELFACFEANANAVDQVEPSISAGASLIIDVLCVEQSVDLNNQMVRARPAIVEEKGFVGALESFKYVMKRELQKALFEIRKTRLGL